MDLNEVNMTLNETEMAPNGSFMVASSETEILFHIVSVFGLIGNVLVLLCIVKSPKLKSHTFKLFGNVNVADLLSNLQYISLTIFLQIYDVGMWPHHKEFVFVTSMIYATLEVSLIYMLAAISFHCFVGFTSTQNLKKTITTIWIVAFIIGASHVYASVYTSFTNDKVSTILWTFVRYLIPLMLILLIFCCGKSGRNHHVHAAPKTIDENKEQGSTTTMVVVVIALYFFLWLPACLLAMKSAMFPETADILEEFYESYALYNNIAHLNNSIRPILYFLLSADIRNSLMDLLCCRNSRVSSHPLELNETC